jgi:hypothetical protein
VAAVTAGIYRHVPPTEAGKRQGVLHGAYAADACVVAGNGCELAHEGTGGDSVSWARTPEGHAMGPYRITRKGPRWWARFQPQTPNAHTRHPVYLGMHTSVQAAKSACEKHRDSQLAEA